MLILGCFGGTTISGNTHVDRATFLVSGRFFLHILRLVTKQCVVGPRPSYKFGGNQTQYIGLKKTPLEIVWPPIGWSFWGFPGPILHFTMIYIWFSRHFPLGVVFFLNRSLRWWHGSGIEDAATRAETFRGANFWLRQLSVIVEGWTFLGTLPRTNGWNLKISLKREIIFKSNFHFGVQHVIFARVYLC